MQPLLAAGVVKGMAHITGGGLADNLPRILPGARPPRSRRVVDGAGRSSVAAAAGEVPLDDQYRAFNMGIGLIVAVGAADASRATALLRQAG